MNKQIVIDALERLNDGTKGVVAATISDCQKVIGDLEYEAQEREKIVVQLRKQWQDAEMFICTMCGHFDHKIDGNIVYGNKDCGEISGYPYCKKFTPWIPTSVRLPEIGQKCLIANREIVVRGWLRPDGVWKTGVSSDEIWSKFSLYPPTHWMPLPAPPKEDAR